MFKTPILFVIFNRPDTTQQVFDEIKKQKPRYLYVAADGPRLNRFDDIEKCKQTRAIVEQINWDCELKTLFREENLGCGKAVSGAISWFFENVEQGIILEDDCLPHPDFFCYCEELLNKYKDNKNVKIICGDSYPSFDTQENSYYFSHNIFILGWASWRRVWKDYDYTLKTINLKEFKKTTHSFFHWNKRIYCIDRFLRMKIDILSNKKKIDTWDYQFVFSIWKEQGVSVVPNRNLISNVGFGAESTHTSTDGGIFSKKNLQPILPLQHPLQVKCSKKTDKLINNSYFSSNLVKNVIYCCYHKMRYYFLCTLKKTSDS